MKRALLLIATFAISAAHAQTFILDLPLKSQEAEVSQRIGLTTIDVRYHRPLVNGRKIWGDLVPYGKVWRAGANINTTISVTDPVTIGGKPLDAGTYGLHMIPTASDWTVIFSKNSTSWGSFTYDPAEDALRVTVTPQPSDMHEALTYEFDDVRPDSAVIEMRWEKIAVPLHVGVDVHRVVQASLDKQLRTLGRYTWMSWEEAAEYLLAEKTSLDEALTYSNKSIENEDRIENELTKSKILLALNRNAEASAARERALAVASATQLNDYGAELLQAKHADDAFAVFRMNAKKYPGEWVVHQGLARMYSAQNNFDSALKEMRLALAGAPQSQRESVTESIKKLEAKQDINQ
jgi:hypothetical protein